MDQDKWPKLVVPDPAGPALEMAREPSVIKLGEEDIMDNISTQSMGATTDKEEDSDQGWAVSVTKRGGKRCKNPVVATRTSSRISKTDGPILEKATKRRQEKDALMKGNPNCNPFTVLNNAPSSHLAKVIEDLDIEVADMDTQLETFRAEERVRAP